MQIERDKPKPQISPYDAIVCITGHLIISTKVRLETYQTSRGSKRFKLLFSQVHSYNFFLEIIRNRN